MAGILIPSARERALVVTVGPMTAAAVVAVEVEVEEAAVAVEVPSVR